MTRKLWWASLNKASPRYDAWREILGSDDVPLKHPGSGCRDLGGNLAEVYELDLGQMTAEQSERLVAWIALKFSVAPELVAADLAREGFPIRAEDLWMAFGLRLFV